MTSLDASVLSDESLYDQKSDLDRGRKGHLTKPRKLEKRPKSPRKWNFFHRSQPTSKPTEEAVADSAVQVTLGRQPLKAIPHYAMLDSSDEPEDADGVDLEDLLRDAEVVDLSNDELDALQFGNYKENIRRIEKLQEVSKPSIQESPLEPVIFSSPEPMPTTPDLPRTELHLSKETAPIRPSRLPQVGRIPKVISARPEATSPKSFSRPFARLSTLQPLSNSAVLDQQSLGFGPSPPKPSTPEPKQATRDVRSPPLHQDSTTSDGSQSGLVGATHRDFLAFSPRKDSATTTSSSGGLSSFAGTTAVIPEADAELVEDEVWNEYDDLIENDDTVKMPVSATSSHGGPFQYESYESRRIRKSKVQAKESPTLTFTPAMKDESSTRMSALTTSSVYSADMTARIKDAFATVPSPTTPMSFTDFFSGYGDRNNSVHGDSAKKPRQTSQSSYRKSNELSSSSHSRSGSGLITIAEKPSNPSMSHLNLRVASMTVSKWLTFDHVLFSPAREEIADPEKRHSILVIDGLGNGGSPSLLSHNS